MNDRLKAALDENKLLCAAIDKEIHVLSSWRQYCFGGPGGEEWDSNIDDTVDWVDVAWSITERLRKATGRPKPCGFCHGAGTLDVDLGQGTEEVGCRACDGLGDGEPWEVEE